MTLAPILPERDEWTVDDLAQLPPDLRYELINGRLIILSSPTFVHQKICVETYRALEQNCPPDRHPALDLSLKVDSRNEPRPDILVVDPARGWRSPLPIEDASWWWRWSRPARPLAISGTRSSSTPRARPGLLGDPP